jgi:hypothetical protein
MIERFSLWPEAVKEMTTESVASALYMLWISRFGGPKDHNNRPIFTIRISLVQSLD